MSDDAKTDLAVLTARTRYPAALANASGMQKLDWILSLPNPPEFVGSLAPHELYYWLRDIGPDDAYPLLEYADEEQLKCLVDIDAWSRHSLSLPRWLHWLDLALAVDEDTAARFLAAQEDDLLMTFLTGDLQVLPADADLDLIPDELAFFTSPDGMYVVTVPREHPLEERLPQLMRLLWSSDIDRARALLQQAQFELNAATSEELERFRNARLQDLGFESPTDALEVFSFLPIKVLRQELAHAEPPPVSAAPSAPLPEPAVVGDLVLRGVEPPELLRAAVSALDERDRRTFGNGFAYLTNKVFMAETGDLSRLDDLPAAARQAAAVANLGLAYLAFESAERAAVVVRQVTPETLFKAGWTLLFELGRKARRLAARAGQERGFTLFGTPTDEAIQAASALRPQYASVIDDPAALELRPFATLEDVAKVEARVAHAGLLLDAFETHFGLTLGALEEAELPGIGPDARRRIRLATLVRTALLHAVLGAGLRFSPVTRDELVAFSRAAFTRDAHLTPVVDEAVRQLLAIAIADDATRAAFADLVQRALAELVEALGPVHERDLDLRFVGDLFLVASS